MLAPNPLTTKALDRLASNRRELKFVLPSADIGSLISVLSTNLHPYQFGKGLTSQVSSIYFDDPSFASYRESLAGVTPRNKFRLRWYDEPFASRNAWYECKRRDNLDIKKARVAIELPEPLQQLEYPKLIKLLCDALSPQYAEQLLLRPEPTVLVSYQRRHFRSSDGEIRVTIDYDLTAYEQLGRRKPERRFPASLPTWIVMEVKTAVVKEQEVREWLYPLRPRLSRSSKYVQCCAELALPGLEISAR